jgi:hypothetical protein
MITQEVDTAEQPICEECDNELELHQPDKTNPDKLLGICDICHSWYVIESKTDGCWFAKLDPAALFTVHWNRCGPISRSDDHL